MIKKIVLNSLIILSFVCCTGQHQKIVVNYYFDAQNGSDENAGTSPEKPFRSFTKLASLTVKGGDSILLKSGCVFTEKFYFSGKGEDGKPIVIGKYGGNDKPHLKGDASELEMMHIYNSEHIVIRDLEISNKGEKIRPHLNGLLVELYNYGKAKDITVDNLFVHDVFGSLRKGDGYQHEDVGAGQAISIRSLRGGESDSILSCFDGLTIQNCLIKDCQRNGIMMWGNWVRKYWMPSTHVVIRNNVLDGVPGDGIVPVGCDGVLVEYNVMKNCPPTLSNTEACDGIWPWGCDNAVVQYNVVSDHKSQVDGYAYDSDYDCNNSLFQYNLSYNNDGGFLLLCNSGGWPKDFSTGNNGTTVRYNVSINDGIRNYIVEGKKDYFSPVIHITGSTENSRIEKNIFYVKKKKLPQMDKRLICSDDWRGYADSTYVLNNYIYVEESTIAFDGTESTHNFVEGNLFVGQLSKTDGFKEYNGKFGKQMWYNPQDKNWDKLYNFLKDKKIHMEGRDVPVLDIIGWN